MTAYAVANALSAVAASYGLLLASRFLCGVPHGAFFGVASLVAASLAPRGREGRAVATVMIGLSVANVVGVPAATWLGQTVGWRAAFWVAAGLALRHRRPGGRVPAVVPGRRRGDRSSRAARSSPSRRRG